MSTDDKEACGSLAGLAGCAETAAGGLAKVGLSNGQRRRLSVAIALAKEPRVVFCDEPTTGLDAAAASAIASFLARLARETRAAILCTIHQVGLVRSRSVKREDTRVCVCVIVRHRVSSHRSV